MKTYNVTIWNKANKLHATYNAYGVKDLLKSMVGITSFYQPDAIKLLANLMDTSVDTIVEKIMNQEYFCVDNSPNLHPGLILDFQNSDNDSEDNGLYLSFFDKNINESFTLEALIER